MRPLLPLLLCAACAGPPGPQGERGKAGQDAPPRGEENGPTWTLTEDTTWDGDMLLDRLVLVPEGVTLTIAAGVEVALLPTGGIAADGTLDLQGDSTTPVRFVPGSQVNRANHGVAVAGGPPVLSFADFEQVDFTVVGDGVRSLGRLNLTGAQLRVERRTTRLEVNETTVSDNLVTGGSALVARDLPELVVRELVVTDAINGIDFSGLQDDAVLDVSDSVFTGVQRALQVGASGSTTQVLDARGVVIAGTSSIGISARNTAVSLDELALSDVEVYGIYTHGDSSLVVAHSTLTDVTSIGIFAAAGPVDVSNTTLERIGSHGVYTFGDTTLTDVTVAGAINCIDVNDPGLLVGAALDVSDCSGDGVEHSGLATITGLTTSAIDAYGIHAVGALDLTDALIAGAGIHGILANDDAVLNDVVIDQPGSRGIQAFGGQLQATNLSILGTPDWGIYADHGIIDRCSIVDAGTDAIYFAGSLPSTVSGCDITDSGQFGIRGHASLDHSLQVLGNNITGSASWALHEVGLVDGNHVFGNNGQPGVDMISGGVLDGIRNTTSIQIFEADQILNPQFDPVLYTGTY